MENKETNQKTYIFQDMSFTLKKRVLAVRKETYLLLHNFMQYVSDFGDKTEENISIALMTYLSDEEKLKELFGKILDGEVDKISYDAEDDEKYIELLTFASKVFTDFFSYTLMLPKQTLRKSKKKTHQDS